MLDIPKSLPALRKRLILHLDSLAQWNDQFRSYAFADDIRLFVAILDLCQRTAVACMDDAQPQARQLILRAVRAADQWGHTESGRQEAHNWIGDHYGGTHSDTFNAQTEAAIALAEELSDWEFTAAAVRATNEYNGDPFDFDTEAAVLLARIRSLRACAEAVVVCGMEQKRVTPAKVRVAQYEIAAWGALIQDL